MPSVTPSIRAVGLATKQIFESLKHGQDSATVSVPPQHEHLRPELVRVAQCVLSACQRQCKYFNGKYATSLTAWTPDQTDWDSKTYHDVTRTQNGSNPVREQEFREQFRPLNPGETIRDPCTCLDRVGRVEVLFLPDALSHQRQVCGFSSLAYSPSNFI